MRRRRNWGMVERVHVRTSYRYASSAARDQAVSEALGMLPDSPLRYTIKLGEVLIVEVALELFRDHDYTLFALLERTSIERSVTIV